MRKEGEGGTRKAPTKGRRSVGVAPSYFPHEKKFLARSPGSAQLLWEKDDTRTISKSRARCWGTKNGGPGRKSTGNGTVMSTYKAKWQ